MRTLGAIFLERYQYVIFWVQDHLLVLQNPFGWTSILLSLLFCLDGNSHAMGSTMVTFEWNFRHWVGAA